MEDEAENGRHGGTVDALAEAEGFALDAVVGRSLWDARQMKAANDERPRRASHLARRHSRKFNVPQGMARFAEGLRAISKRRSG